ncbi:MAG: hypothetical protein Q9176_002541 [Flavoplaca citrina]
MHLMSYWLRMFEEGIIDTIHGSKVGHICKKDVAFDNVSQRGARRFKNGKQVMQCLSLGQASVTACEKNGNGGGALSVCTALLMGSPRKVAEVACDESMADEGPRPVVDEDG